MSHDSEGSMNFKSCLRILTTALLAVLSAVLMLLRFDFFAPEDVGFGKLKQVSLSRALGSLFKDSKHRLHYRQLAKPLGFLVFMSKPVPSVACAACWGAVTLMPQTSLESGDLSVGISVWLIGPITMRPSHFASLNVKRGRPH